jgi:hypothetical protein
MTLLAVPVATVLLAQAPLGFGQEPGRGSVGRGWPVSGLEFDFVGGVPPDRLFRDLE